MGVLDRDPEGGPESRLWAGVVGRGYGYPNGPTDEEAHLTYSAAL
jgi:hypothetical protein